MPVSAMAKQAVATTTGQEHAASTELTKVRGGHSASTELAKEENREAWSDDAELEALPFQIRRRANVPKRRGRSYALRLQKDNPLESYKYPWRTDRL